MKIKNLAIIGMLALMIGGLLVTSVEARHRCDDRWDRGHHHGWNNRYHRQISRADAWRDRRIANVNNRWDNRRDRINDRYNRWYR